MDDLPTRTMANCGRWNRSSRNSRALRPSYCIENACAKARTRLAIHPGFEHLYAADLAFDGAGGSGQDERRVDGVEVAVRACGESAGQHADRGSEHLVESFDSPSLEQFVQRLGPGVGDMQRELGLAAGAWT
jgi:hypothetical protein